MGHGVVDSPQPARLRGLRIQLLILALIVLVPALSVGGTGAWMALRSYDNALQDRLQDTARALGLAFEREVERHFSTLAGLAASPALDAGPDADLAPFFRHARGAATAIGAPVLLIGPDLRIRLDTDRPLGTALPVTAATAATRRALETGRPTVSNLLIGAISAEPAIVVQGPVIRDGQVLGTVGTRIAPAQLSHLLATPDLAEGTFAALIDPRHRLVARSRAAERFSGAAAPAGLVRAMEGRRIGSGRGRTLEGEEALYVFRALDRIPGWSIVVVTSLAAHRTSWRGPLLVLAGGGVAAGLLALGAAWLLSRRVLAPLAVLQRQAEAVAGGAGEALAVPATAASKVAEFAALQRAISAADAALRCQMETARTTAAALQASERRCRAWAEVGAIAMWQADRDGNIISSHGWEVLTGQTPEQLRGAGWAAALHPEDAEPLLARWRAARGERRQVSAQFRVRRRDGAWHWVRARGVPVLDEQGTLAEWAGVVEDADAQHRAEEMRRLLAQEVDHRAKNVLSVVQSVLRLTRVEEPQAFVAAVEARIAALARAHALLAQEGGAGAELRTVAERELAPYGALPFPPGGAVRLEGPRVPLAVMAVQPLAMVLHELATNAAKYGALSRPGGTLTLRWVLDHEAGLLALDWLEGGGPPLAGPPLRRGFGSRVIETTIRSQLRGQVERHWEEAGLVCRILLPLERAVTADEARPDRVAA